MDGFLSVGNGIACMSFAGAVVISRTGRAGGLLRLLRHRFAVVLAVFLLVGLRVSGDDVQLTEVRIQGTGGEQRLAGRVVAEGEGGELLLEDVAGRMRQLSKGEVLVREDRRGSWQPADAEALGQLMKVETGSGFEVHQTEHYLLCSNCSEGYNEFMGRLLETVYDQYFQFWQKLKVPLQPPDRPLPVVLFQAESEFLAYAGRIHPETDFAGVPGFYSVRDNLVLVVDLTRDRALRDLSAVRKALSDRPLQVATVVHEAVHQLSFNSGLQQRFADFPVWYSEGLSLYFEPPTERSAVLWSRPGQVSGRHHPEFLRLVQDDELSLPLADLLVNDGLFQSGDTAAAAYAESWGLVSYLVKKKPAELALYAQRLQGLRPLRSVTAAERRQMFMECTGEDPSELAGRLIPWVRRLRVAR